MHLMDLTKRQLIDLVETAKIDIEHKNNFLILMKNYIESGNIKIEYINQLYFMILQELKNDGVI